MIGRCDEWQVLDSKGVHQKVLKLAWGGAINMSSTRKTAMTPNLFRSAALSLLLALVTGLASAGPIVAAGSSYSVYIAGNQSGNVLNTGPVLFDANATAFSRAGLSLSLSEGQVDNGNGKHTITINMTANGDLFPTAGEASLLGLGTQGTPLSFLNEVFLDSARISFFGADGSIYFTTANLADDYRVQYFSGAWGATFRSPTAFSPTAILAGATHGPSDSPLR